MYTFILFLYVLSPFTMHCLMKQKLFHLNKLLYFDFQRNLFFFILSFVYLYTWHRCHYLPTWSALPWVWGLSTQSGWFADMMPLSKRHRYTGTFLGSCCNCHVSCPRASCHFLHTAEATSLQTSTLLHLSPPPKVPWWGMMIRQQSLNVHRQTPTHRLGSSECSQTKTTHSPLSGRGRHAGR